MNTNALPRDKGPEHIKQVSAFEILYKGTPYTVDVDPIREKISHSAYFEMQDTQKNIERLTTRLNDFQELGKQQQQSTITCRAQNEQRFLALEKEIFDLKRTLKVKDQIIESQERRIDRIVGSDEADGIAVGRRA